MFDTIEDYERNLEKRKNRYNPRGGAIHPEEDYEGRNRVSSMKPKKFWEI